MDSAYCAWRIESAIVGGLVARIVSGRRIRITAVLITCRLVPLVVSTCPVLLRIIVGLRVGVGGTVIGLRVGVGGAVVIALAAVINGVLAGGGSAWR